MSKARSAVVQNLIDTICNAATSSMQGLQDQITTEIAETPPDFKAIREMLTECERHVLIENELSDLVVPADLSSPVELDKLIEIYECQIQGQFIHCQSLVLIFRKMVKDTWVDETTSTPSMNESPDAPESEDDTPFDDAVSEASKATNEEEE